MAEQGVPPILHPRQMGGASSTTSPRHYQAKHMASPAGAQQARIGPPQMPAGPPGPVSTAGVSNPSREAFDHRQDETEADDLPQHTVHTPDAAHPASPGPSYGPSAPPLHPGQSGGSSIGRRIGVFSQALRGNLNAVRAASAGVHRSAESYGAWKDTGYGDPGKAREHQETRAYQAARRGQVFEGGEILNATRETRHEAAQHSAEAAGIRTVVARETAGPHVATAHFTAEAAGYRVGSAAAAQRTAELGTEAAGHNVRHAAARADKAEIQVGALMRKEAAGAARASSPKPKVVASKTPIPIVPKNKKTP